MTSSGGLGLAPVMLNTVPSVPVIMRHDPSTPDRAQAVTETISPSLGAASADDDSITAPRAAAAILSALIARSAFSTPETVLPAARHSLHRAHQNGISSSISPRLPPAAAIAGLRSRPLGPEEPNSPPPSSEPKSLPPRSPARSSEVSWPLKAWITTSVVYLSWPD